MLRPVCLQCAFFLCLPGFDDVGGDEGVMVLPVLAPAMVTVWSVLVLLARVSPFVVVRVAGLALVFVSAWVVTLVVGCDCAQVGRELAFPACIRWRAGVRRQKDRALFRPISRTPHPVSAPLGTAVTIPHVIPHSRFWHRLPHPGDPDDQLFLTVSYRQETVGACRFFPPRTVRKTSQ